MIRFSHVLVLPVLVGTICSAGFGSTQGSPVTNVMCPNPVVVTLTITDGVWFAEVGSTKCRLSKLAAPLREALDSNGTTSVMLRVPRDTPYRQIMKAGDVCRDAGSDCVNFGSSE